MPYTRNTRIKVTKHLHKTNYKAQVEYQYPLIGLKEWVNIQDVEHSLVHYAFMKGSPLPYMASVDCALDISLEDVRGIEWAKALIDQYHKLFDESEFKPVVEYVKYP